jgi:hypothetical protein
MRVHSIAAGAVVLVAALAACSGSKQNQNQNPAPYGTGDPTLTAINVNGGPINPFLTDGNAVRRAIATVAPHYAPLRLTSISAVSGAGLVLDVVEPIRRDKVVRYMFSPNGKTLGPIRVKLVVAGAVATPADIAALAFDPNTIAFERLAPAVRDAIARSKLQDGRISQWGLGGAKKHIYMVIDAVPLRRFVLYDHHLRFVRTVE